ncbi:MAG TPA: hypothetical protein DCW46_02680, partial [Desulfotomaculum sp.]|nr:hypothetical protein [Desulfotomaculum sp.]
MRKSKKLIAILATLALLVTMLVPMVGPAAAGTTYESLTVPTVDTGDDRDLGTLYIKIDPFAQDSAAIFSLPADFVLDVDDFTVLENDADVAALSNLGTDNEFKLDLNFGSFGGTEEYTVKIGLKSIDIPDGFSGDIELTVTSVKGQLPSGTVVVGRTSDGEVTLSVVDVPTFGDNGTENGKIKINVKENTAGALDKTTTSLKFKLPANFEWVIFDDNNDSNGDVLDISGSGDPSEDVFYTVDGRTLIVVCNEDNYKGFYRIVADIIPGTDAKNGDVKVSVSGDSSLTPSSLLVGKYADYGFETSLGAIPEVLAGREDQEIAELTIEENVDNSIPAGRTLVLTLPVGAVWANPGIQKTEGGFGVASITLANDDRECKIKFSQGANTAAGKITFKDIKVNLAPDLAAGDLIVKASGSAGISGDIPVATIIAPVTVTADNKDLIIGKAGQVAGDITITENQKEALIGGKTLELELPDEVAWDGDPTVEVTSGDLEIENVDTDTDGNLLTFDIKSDSSTASTIKISDIQYKVNRSVVEGPIKVKVKSGEALCDWLGDLDDVNLEKHDVVTTVVNATVVTPAPGDQKATVVFTINDTNFTVNGAAQAMDVAPYIKDGRTFL